MIDIVVNDTITVQERGQYIIELYGPPRSQPVLDLLRKRIRVTRIEQARKT